MDRVFIHAQDKKENEQILPEYIVVNEKELTEQREARQMVCNSELLSQIKDKDSSSATTGFLNFSKDTDYADGEEYDNFSVGDIVVELDYSCFETEGE